MARQHSEYTRLPGGKSSLFRRHTLWLGSDHLLRVRSTRFSEEYRRYYFRDIQAICMQKRPPRSWLPHALTAGAGLLFSAGLFRLGHPVWATLLMLVTVIYALAIWRRTDCECWLQTAVGINHLPSLCRSRRAAKALAIIHARLSEAQKGAADLDLTTVLASPPPFPSVAPQPAPPHLPSAGAAPSFGPYVFAFVFLLALGILKGASAISPAWLPRMAMPLGYVLFMAAILIPLIRRGIARLSLLRRIAVLTSLGVVGAMGSVAVRWWLSRATVTMRDANADRLYSGLAASVGLNVCVAAILILLAIFGLFAFLGEWESAASGGNGPLTLFGTERP